ncbi:MAG: hypothetical protein M3R10_08910 [Verrucomicrobiota bacterium]|nr:hypothetical protein [Verrucomicrobiota bacterium]
MGANETEISFEQPRSGFGAWLGIVLLFFVFALFVWAVFGMMPHGNDYEQKRADVRLEKLKTVREEANKALQGYGWVDKSKGVVRLPVERAMEVTLVDLANKKPAVAYPIPPEVPAESATAPTAPSPGAANASPSPAGSLPKATAITGKDSEMRGQKDAAANPPNAAPASQPGASATPAASPPAPSSQARPNPNAPMPTPVQSPAGTPIPIPGKTP